MSQQFMHRNGETEPPTEDRAFFWFDRDGDGSWIKIEGGKVNPVFGMFFVMDGRAHSLLAGYSIELDKLSVRWWGPVDSPQMWKE